MAGTFLTDQEIAYFREGLMKLTNEGIQDAEATYKDITPNEFGSKQAYEIMRTHGGLGLLATRREGQRVVFDSPVGGTEQRIYPILMALGVKYSKQSKYKDMYGFIKGMAPLLAESAIETLNKQVADVFNLGFSGGGFLSPDGQPLFSASHPIKTGGTQSNLGSVSIGSVTLGDAIAAVNAQVGPRNIPKHQRHGLKLVHGTLLEPDVVRAVESDRLAGTSDNDTNAYVKRKIKQVVCEDYIGFGQSGMEDMWALIPADAKKNPIFVMKVQGFEMDSDKDITRGEIIYVGEKEDAVGVTTHLGTWASNP